jgi:hypothetical protein
MDLAHHVEKDLVGWITTVHRATDFRGGEAANVSTCVIELAISTLKPVFEGKSQGATFRIVTDHVGDGSHAEKRILSTGWGAARCSLQRGRPELLELFDLVLVHGSLLL